tara:strand:- start:307 stop:540 length:234 start_codon:yes stop_codon:yes gene_type:complete
VVQVDQVVEQEEMEQVLQEEQVIHLLFLPFKERTEEILLHRLMVAQVVVVALAPQVQMVGVVVQVQNLVVMVVQEVM